MTTALRILMVEDYEPFRRAICSWLRERDFQVMDTADGLEAIEKAIELQPDVVLVDIGLPTLIGIESAKQVRMLECEGSLRYTGIQFRSDTRDVPLGLTRLPTDESSCICPPRAFDSPSFQVKNRCCLS